MDRREIVEVFRRNLLDVIERSGLSRSAFAAKVGLDRSTLSQLLSDENVRLPRSETIASLARSERVSVDWLLGLSQEGQLGTDVVDQRPELEPGRPSPADERLQRWHAEAAGYKIRYVPSNLPDLLKTQDVIDFEYRSQGSAVPEARARMAEHRLEYSRRPETDMEVCTSFQLVEGFARGEGIWRFLPAEQRYEQIEVMIARLDELYPTFRWFLFDGLRHYSLPVTIFGPQRVAIYAGDMYIVFNSTDQIREFTRHFDNLIRAAVVQPPDVVGFLQSLALEVEGEERKGRGA